MSIAVVEPITIQEAQSQLRIDDLSDEAFPIELFIGAVREMCESATRRALIVKQEVLTFNSFPVDQIGVIELPKPPYRHLDSIVYTDKDGVSRTLASTEYRVISDTQDPVQCSYLIPAYNKSWPNTLDDYASVKIAYTCGYGKLKVGDVTTTIDAPKSLKQWMLINLANLYEHRETLLVGNRITLVDVSTLADALIANYRIAKF